MRTALLYGFSGCWKLRNILVKNEQQRHISNIQYEVHNVTWVGRDKLRIERELSTSANLNVERSSQNSRESD